MAAADSQAELLQRAYRLAWFLHGDSDVATAIAVEAVAKLEVAVVAQDKRLYYSPSTRRARVQLNESQLLQRLVYIESEPYERAREQRGEASSDALTLHFVKHLARISLKRNSFYVALALTRILCAYTTSEAREVYGVVSQDSDHIPDDYYYRSRKKLLMQELRDRFGSLLETSRGSRGEERFASREDQLEALATVRDALSLFTPWTTRCPLPAQLAPREAGIPLLTSSGGDPDAQHVIEMNRIHALLHPPCFERLAAALGLPLFEQRLDLPRFAVASMAGPGPDRIKPPPLSGGCERARNELRRRTDYRRGFVAQAVIVLIDGEPVARIDPRHSSAVRLDVARGAERLEVRAEAADRSVLIAIYMFDYESDGERLAAFDLAVEVKDAGTLRLTTSGADAPVSVEYEQGVALWKRILGGLVMNGFLQRKFLAPVAATVLVVASTAGVYYTMRYSGDKAEAGAERAKAEAGAEKAEAGAERNEVTATTERKESAASEPEIAKAEAGAEKAEAGAERTRVATARGRNGDSGAIADGVDQLRGLGSAFVGVELPMVRKVTLRADGPEAQPVLEPLGMAITGSNVLTVANPVDADAQLLVAPAKAGSSVPGQTAVQATLVNAEGKVLWTEPRVEGTPESIADQLVKKLISAIAVAGR